MSITIPRKVYLKNAFFIQVIHPIHDQTFYLNSKHKKKLKEEFGEFFKKFVLLTLFLFLSTLTSNLTVNVCSL